MATKSTTSTKIEVELIDIESINTIAELSGVDNSKINDVIVNSFSSIGDGGGGNFVYNFSQSGTNNGGTIIDGWVREYTGLMKTEWFGYSTPEFYVSTTGSDTALGMGLDISAPLLTIQQAVDNAKMFDIEDNKQLIINLAAGSYAGGIAFINKKTAQRILIKGPDKDYLTNEIPTAIIDGVEGNGTLNGISFGDDMYVELRHVKVQNFVGGGSTQSGVLITEGGNLQATNVHVYNIKYACLNYNGRCTARVQGGYYDTADIGIRFYSETHFSIGIGGSAPTGSTTSGRVKVVNCAISAVSAMGSSGHIDYLDISANFASAYGIHLFYNSRAHIVSVYISGTGNYGVYASYGSTYNNGAGELTFAGTWTHLDYLVNGSYLYEEPAYQTYVGGATGVEYDKHILPKTNVTQDLGSSTQRWNNIYATTYYYGTNAGIDTVFFDQGGATVTVRGGIIISHA